MKTCSTCGHEKPTAEFYPDGRYASGYKSQCIDCKHDGTVRSRLRRHLMKAYGITVEQYEKMIEEQKGLCAICGRTETRLVRKRGTGTRAEARLAIDHDHLTGKVRGLLCGTCNMALGLFGEDAERLMNAYNYLIKP